MRWNGRLNPVDPDSSIKPASSTDLAEAPPPSNTASTSRGSSTDSAYNAAATQPADAAEGAPAPPPAAEGAAVLVGGATTALRNGNGALQNGNGAANGSGRVTRAVLAGSGSNGGWVVANVTASYDALNSGQPSNGQQRNYTYFASTGKSAAALSSASASAAANGAGGSAASSNNSQLAAGKFSVDDPAPLQGVHEGDVTATMSDETAETQWPGCEAEDPEYVI